MTDYKLTQIYIYPVKSLPGISLHNTNVEERGLKYDRRWMLIDELNMFITQRDFPSLIFIDVKIKNEELIFTHKTKKIGELRISINDIPEQNVEVNVWEDFCAAKEYSLEVNEWFSEAIETKCKLVYMPNTTERKTSTKYFPESKNYSFADGYPFLIIGEESLNLLNSKLSHPVTMNQFRPNLVFSGGKPHDEDNWKNVKIGNLDFTIVKPCARCVITTIDQNGKKNKEPLATLNTYRNKNNKIIFGQNVVGHSKGSVKVGDKIIIE